MLWLAELRTIGFSDASDSELSIRQLDLTPNDSEISFHLSPNQHTTYKTGRKISKESIDSGCQNETNIDETKQTDHHCDIIVDITNRNANRKNKLDLTVNKSSSSTLSDVSSSSKLIDNTKSDTNSRKKHSKKYHSAKRRLRKESIISRSRSFQEQDVKANMRNSRFFVRRHDTHPNEYSLDESVSHHNIEITVEDMDDINKTCSSRQLLNADQSTNKDSKIESTSLDSYELNYGNHNKVRSSHIWGRIFRRMRKLSVGWRKPRCKTRRRGEFLL